MNSSISMVSTYILDLDSPSGCLTQGLYVQLCGSSLRKASFALGITDGQILFAFVKIALRFGKSTKTIIGKLLTISLRSTMTSSKI